MSSVAAVSVAAFLASIGVNANINTSTEASIVAQSSYVGLNHVRVEAPTSADAAGAFASIAAKGGLKYNDHDDVGLADHADDAEYHVQLHRTQRSIR